MVELGNTYEWRVVDAGRSADEWRVVGHADGAGMRDCLVVVV